jgi:type II secretion system protein C
MNIHKFFFVVKLVLFLLLGHAVLGVVTLPGQMHAQLGPSLAGAMVSTYKGVSQSPVAITQKDFAEIFQRNPFYPLEVFGNSTTPGIADDGRIAYPWGAGDDLGLTLLGTVSGSPLFARAIIKDLRTGALDLYKTNQAVGDAQIQSIEKDAVVLEYEGRTKILKLNAAQNGTPPEIDAETSSLETTGKYDDFSEIDLGAQDEIAKFRTDIDTVDAILKQAVIESYMVDGRMEGLKISGLDKIRAAKALGLENGDVIQVINGQKLTSKQKAYQIFKKARSKASVSFELLRGDETKKLVFFLR